MALSTADKGGKVYASFHFIFLLFVTWFKIEAVTLSAIAVEATTLF